MNLKKKISGICKRCLRRNHRCIKDEAYIGYCAQNDYLELKEYYNSKRK